MTVRPKTIQIDKICLNGGTQARLALNEATVLAYMEVLKELPPVVVFFDGTDNWLADGFHTLEAYSRAGEKRVPVDLRDGSLNDAILFGAGANGAHGLPRSHDDKLRAVTMVLLHDEGRKWSARQTAKHCHVSQDFVSRIILGRKEATAARRVNANDSPPAGTVAGSVSVAGKQVPLIKPKKRAKSKMGFETKGGLLATQDADGFGGAPDADLTLCAFCGEMVPGGHDCPERVDDTTKAVKGDGLGVDWAPFDEEDARLSGQPTKAAPAPPEDSGPHPTVVSGRPLRRPSPAPGTPTVLPSSYVFGYELEGRRRGLELIGKALMVGVDSEWVGFDLAYLSDEEFVRLVRGMQEART